MATDGRFEVLAWQGCINRQVGLTIYQSGRTVFGDNRTPSSLWALLRIKLLGYELHTHVYTHKHIIDTTQIF
jgi:hypothetical protein